MSNVWLLDSGWVQMNVLHLHLSDYCRFAVESRVFPELTAGLESGEQAGFYTQDQVIVVTRWKRRDERWENRVARSPPHGLDQARLSEVP